MGPFVRKNALVVTATFTPEEGTNQPSTATCNLLYTNLSGVQQTDSLEMSYDTPSGTWSATWDSSAAGPGLVAWVVYGVGALQAAQQGEFMLLANPANVV